MKKYSLLCPFCKETLSFELEDDFFAKNNVDGLASCTLSDHGSPLHNVTVYITKIGIIRSAQVNLKAFEPKITLQNTYIIDATSDLSPKEGQALGAVVLPFTITINNSKPRKYNEEIFFSEVYKALIEDKIVKSYPVSIDNYLNAFRNAPNDKPIITLTASKRYSEGYNNALKALEILQKEKASIAKNIYIIDTKGVGPLMKLMLRKAIELDEKGENLRAILDYMNWIREKHISYVYVDSLDALRKSERVGKVTTFFGNLLGLKPVIIENENNNGDLKPFKVVRSKNEAIKEITKAIRKEFGYVELVGVIFYGIVIEDAQQLQELLKLDPQVGSNDFTMDFIGTGVAIHLSYDVVGISFFTKL